MKNIKKINQEKELHLLQPGKDYLIESVDNEGYPFEITVLETTKKTVLFATYEDVEDETPPTRMTFSKFFEEYIIVEELDEDEEPCCDENEEPCCDEDEEEDLQQIVNDFLEWLDEYIEEEDEINSQPCGTGDINPYTYEPDPWNPITVTYNFTITY